VPDARDINQNQKADGQDNEASRVALPKRDRNRRGREHGDCACQRVKTLADEKMLGIIVDMLGVDRAGAVGHDNTDPHQQTDTKEKYFSAF